VNIRQYLAGAAICCATLFGVAPAVTAQQFLEQYLDGDIESVKQSLRNDGFEDAGHVTKRGATWALMYDGRTCIALHGSRGRIDDIDHFRDRDCERRRPSRNNRDQRMYYEQGQRY
jgi:hypothetical protein